MTISSSSPPRWKVRAARHPPNWESGPFFWILNMFWVRGMGHHWSLLLLQKRNTITSDLGPGEHTFFLKDPVEGCGGQVLLQTI